MAERLGSSFNDVVRAVGSLYHLRATPTRSLDDVVGEISEEMQRLSDESLRLSAGEARDYEAKLHALLGNERLARYFRATILAREAQNTFLDARIITDVRPIFDSDQVSKPAGAVVIHTLALDYWADSSSKELHVLLDSADIDKLKTALDRAGQKGEALTKFIKSADAEYLDTE